MPNSEHTYEVRPRKDHHGVDLISDVLPLGRNAVHSSSAAQGKEIRAIAASKQTKVTTTIISAKQNIPRVNALRAELIAI